MTRLFALYAIASLVPVLVLGVVLARSFRGEANRHGLSEGVAQAGLIARTAVQPLLGDRPLTAGLSSAETASLRRLAAGAVSRGDVLRLRIRDLGAHVVFSDDGSGFGGAPDDEATDAAEGRTISKLTRVNADSDDAGPQGTEAVEVYLPLVDRSLRRRVGVLEIYVPYAPIKRDVTSGLHRLYLELAVGLLGLYVILFAITASVSRGLRRQASLNAFLAEHDVLTALPNRTLFQARAANALVEARETGHAAAVAIIDLDRFKYINDSLGHHSGDQLLTEIAVRLAAHMRPGDTVARLGGDEFGVIVRSLDDPEPVFWRLLELVNREFEISGLPLTVQASLGYASAPLDGEDVDQLLQRADVAMYAAKAHHVGLLRYDAALEQYDEGALALVSELRRAIDEDELTLHYQPQLTSADSRVHAVEALVRWQHPARGLLFPDAFLPLAEQTDVIDKLTRWVLRRALTDLPRLQRSVPGLCVAVNVSARTIGRPAFADEVIALLAELRIPGESLVIEVTETALLADPPRAALVLGALAEAGIGISLDDFGRGQTSLGYLSALPLDEIKIDRSFVMDMLDHDAHAAIVRSVIDLGRNLGLRVVAEGVETEALFHELADLRCDLVQGYLFGRPMAREAAEVWLEQGPPLLVTSAES